MSLSLSCRNGGEAFQLAPGFVALQGYHASLKCCMAGLVLVCDMNVSAFLAGEEIGNG
jgi:Argonaute linker 1 domain